MPFKSLAQVAKFRHLREEGKISHAEFDEWAKETDFSKLPERKLTSAFKQRRKVPEGIHR